MSDDLLKKMIDAAFVNPFSFTPPVGANMMNPLVETANKDPKVKNEMNSVILESFAKDDLYKRAMLGAFQGIEKNTGNLAEIVSLIRSSRGEKQDEMFALIIDVFAISKVKSKREAELAFRAVMKKLSEFSGDVDTIQKLQGFANMVFNMVQSM